MQRISHRDCSDARFGRHGITPRGLWCLAVQAVGWTCRAPSCLQIMERWRLRSAGLGARVKLPVFARFHWRRSSPLQTTWWSGAASGSSSWARRKAQRLHCSQRCTTGALVRLSQSARLHSYGATSGLAWMASASQSARLGLCGIRRFLLYLRIPNGFENIGMLLSLTGGCSSIASRCTGPRSRRQLSRWKGPVPRFCS